MTAPSSASVRDPALPAAPGRTVLLPDEDATAALGRALAGAIVRQEQAIGQIGLVVGLSGDLGAGKTSLVRALLQASGVTGRVKSPSYSLLEPYEDSRLNFYHFDFYRFKSPQEFAERGFGDYFRPGAVCLVEWPEKAGEQLPPADLHIALRVEEAGRSARLVGATSLGEQCLESLNTLR